MRSGLHTILIAAVVACHATVLSAGPALHGLLGLDHGRVGAFPDSEGSGEHLGALGHASDDCVACHLLSLVQFTPEPGPALSIPRVDRTPLDPSPLPQPTDARGHYATRAPPSAPEYSQAV